MAGGGLATDESDSLTFIIFFLVALLFTTPVFLFIAFFSMVALKITSNPGRLRRLTITLLVLGLLANFWIVYDAGGYSTEQLGYGIFFTVCYCIATALLGLRIKL